MDSKWKERNGISTNHTWRIKNDFKALKNRRIQVIQISFNRWIDNYVDNEKNHFKTVYEVRLLNEISWPEPICFLYNYTLYLLYSCRYVAPDM